MKPWTVKYVGGPLDGDTITNKSFNEHTAVAIDGVQHWYHFERIPGSNDWSYIYQPEGHGLPGM